MWIFTANGFLSVAQHPHDSETLLIQAQDPEEMNRIVEALDKIAGQEHKPLPAFEQGCCYAVGGKRADVAAVVSQIVTEINYSKFTQSTYFDFGADPNFILRFGGSGLQLARVKPDRR